jgi:hypothetical protein
MIPAGLTSESMRVRSDLCSKCHLSPSLGATFEIWILEFNIFSAPFDQHHGSLHLIFPAFSRFYPTFTKY